jgi:cell division protein FtsL
MISSCFFLILNKKKSYRLKKEIDFLSKKIERNKEKIKVLQTEIDFLTRPSRIEKIARTIHQPTKKNESKHA